MKKSHFLLIAFIALFVVANFQNVIPISHATSSTSIDATNYVYNTNCGSCTISLTTTNAGDQVLLFVSWDCSPSACGAGFSLTVSDSQFGLIWTKVQETCNSGNIICILEYSAKASSAQTFSSDTITVSHITGVSVGIAVIAIANPVNVGGVYLDSSYQGANGCTTSCGSVSTASLTTSHASEYLFYATATCTAADGTQTPDPFYTSNINYASSCQHTNSGNYLYLGVGYVNVNSLTTHTSTMTSTLNDYLNVIVQGIFATPPTYTVSFVQNGIPSTIGQMLVVNNTIYQENQLPMSFTYNTTQPSTYTYGYYQTVGLYTFQSLTGCGQTSKDGTFSISSSCTVNATYALTPNINNQSQTVEAINNQIAAIIIFIVPSLLILFIFLWVGTEMFHLEGDGLIILMMLAIGAESAINSMIANTFLPIWIGGLAIIFMFAGLVYKRR